MHTLIHSRDERDWPTAQAHVMDGGTAEACTTTCHIRRINQQIAGYNMDVCDFSVDKLSNDMSFLASDCQGLNWEST